MPQVVNPAPSAPICYFKNTSQVQALNDAIALKANSSDVASSLDLKANASDVVSSLDLKANASDVVSSLDLKANASDVASSLSLKADQVAVDATVTSLNASIDTKYPTSVAETRIVEENKFYEAVKANIFISGPDGVTELDYTYLL